MIKYALRCGAGHEFEAWFGGIAAYEALAKAGHLSCAICGGSNVERAIMAPAVARKDGDAPVQPAHEGMGAVDMAPAGAGSAMSAGEDTGWSNRRLILERIRKLRDSVLANSEYVGPRFASEARAIHELAESEGLPIRPIHGEATPDEILDLLEDGIRVAPVPALPEDRN